MSADGETGPENPSDVQYLDLDGDGVPDAVATTRLRGIVGPDGVVGAEVIEEIDEGIDIDGVPRTVTVVDVVEVSGPERDAGTGAAGGDPGAS